MYHYHSIYDSQHWQEAYADPGFEKHVRSEQPESVRKRTDLFPSLQVILAKHLGLLALRVVDAIVLPLNTTHYALELDDYLDV